MIQEFEKHKYNLSATGSGLGEVGKVAVENKDVGKAASKTIDDALKAAKKYKKQQKAGDGFEKF